MRNKFVIKGVVRNPETRPVAGLQVKAYDEQGFLISGAVTNENGNIALECDRIPKSIKLVYDKKIVKTIAVTPTVEDLADLGIVEIQFIPPAEWHIKGTVTDIMSGEPLAGLTVQIFDVDETASGATYHDWLGQAVTGDNGQFHVWFDTHAFERDDASNNPPLPDIQLVVRDSQNVVIHETPIDQNVPGKPHSCPHFLSHSGKEYELQVDYVTCQINKVGPVPIADITTNGCATYAGLSNRPFGGQTTISGRIWGTYVDHWALYCGEGLVDSQDTRLKGLLPTSPESTPTGIHFLATGTNKVWDGPIYTIPEKIKGTNAQGQEEEKTLEGTYTIVLVAWSKIPGYPVDEYHAYWDTQPVVFHNKIITPPAQISAPLPGTTISKAATANKVAVQGTASDEFFNRYGLLWVGPAVTEVQSSQFSSYDTSTPVVNGKLADWDIASLPVGPYFLRLEVHDRAIRDDGARVQSDWTWNTLTIVD